MIYQPSALPIILFLLIVLSVLGISIYSARNASSAKGFFAAGGTIPWAVNGIAFAGDYLSAASFLGICGMIAFFGYDGFLYSIGYLAGWIVALFVVAEPLKKMGKYTFADALDAKFNSKGIQLTAGISTLMVSIFYLVPQMVGAGALVTPLLGLPHYAGVIIVGVVVIFIVATAGMRSTTYVQFIKGSLLLIFTLVLVVLVINKGLSTKPTDDYHDFVTLNARLDGETVTGVDEGGYRKTGEFRAEGLYLVRLNHDGYDRWWKFDDSSRKPTLTETLSIVTTGDGEKFYNGAHREEELFFPVGHLSTVIVNGREVDKADNLNPFTFLSTIESSVVMRFIQKNFAYDTEAVSVWYQEATPGNRILRPGLNFKIDTGSTPLSKLNFISLMIALFLGTSALPHVLIRYYTVPSARDARRSTILAIVAIGFFYILTLYIGLGAMLNGVIDVESSNMSAPLLARAFGPFLFAIISAIAFATILGTVSGLIIASSGAVAHDLVSNYFGADMSDRGRVVIGKVAAVAVGIIAILLGILFKGVNVSFLVGLAFAVAASANFPAIIMLLFWKQTTAQGITASVFTGMTTAVGIILLSPTMYTRYGLDPASAPIPLDNPGIISIPLSFAVLIIVSLLTQKKAQVSAETAEA